MQPEMFEDAYEKHRHWHKVVYERDELEEAVERAALWADAFVRDFAAQQAMKIPWLNPR